jgi:acetyl-CoA acetyltransferase
MYGTRVEDLAEVAATIRTHGAQNPEAVMFGRRVSRADVLASRLIAEPFRLLDCALTSEGGAGIVLTSAARARDLDVTPIWILGGALDRCGMSYVTPPVWDRYGDVGARAAKIAFGQCGLAPADVDVAELYDPFSFEVIRQLEAFAFCARGEGGAFVREGRIGVGGALPVATNGGLLSFSHAGLAQLLQKPIAAVQQLRGQLPSALTVAGAEVALATNGGAGALFCDALLLGRNRA